MSACLAETRADPAHGRDAIPGPAIRRGPLVCSDRQTARRSVGDAHPGPAHFVRIRKMRLQTARRSVGDAHPGPAHFVRIRKMRLRSTTTTTTTTGATTWRVGPSGMAPLPWWRRVRSRRDRRSVRRGPAAGLPPASWSGTGPWPARVGGTGALRRNGDLFAKAYETCGRRGAGALRPGVSTYSLPCRSPPMVRVFPAPIPGGALGPKAQGGGSPVPAGTAKGSGLVPGQSG